MAVSTTSFSERLDRINARAAAGASGFVTPGVVDASNVDQVAAKTPKARRSYLGTALSGAFMSICVMALGVMFVVSDLDNSGLETLTSSLLASED